jgi:hypothetical protein
MKKLVLSLVVLMLFSFLMADVYTIGTGTDIYLWMPLYHTYDYSWSKMIYTASELSSAGLSAGPVVGIAFQLSATTSNFLTTSQHVYLRHTTSALYSPTDNMLPDNADFQSVYANDYIWNGTSWQYVFFSTPFIWDGSSNIEILWENHDGDYAVGNLVFRWTDTEYPQAAYARQDNSFPASVPGNITTHRPNIQFVTPQTEAPEPAILVYPGDGALTYLNSTLSWASGGGFPDSYDLYFGDTMDPPFVGNLTASSYTPTLAPSSSYWWKVVPRNAIGPAADCPVWSFSTPGAYQLAESFEDPTFPPEDWANDSIDPWTRSTDSWAFDGSAVAYQFGSDTIGYTLSTPMLTISMGDIFRFSSSVTLASSTLDVVYSTDRTNWSLLQTINHSVAHVWQANTIDLSSIDGNYYLGIRTGLQRDNFYIDHFFGPNIAEFLPGTPELILPYDYQTEVSEETALYWNAPSTGGEPTGYNVYLDTSDGSTLLASNVTSPYTPATAWDFDTTYYWTVEAFNRAGTGPQAPVCSFTTRPDPVVSSFPWTVNFGSNFWDWPVEHWSQRSGVYPISPSIFEQWVQDDWQNISGQANKAARLDIQGSSCNGWLVSPAINVPGAGYALTFDLSLTSSASPNPILDPEGQADDRFIVAMSDNPEMFNPTILREWNNSGSAHVFNSIPNTGTQVTITLSSFSGTRYFAFYGESTADNGNNDLFVDNVTVLDYPTTPRFAYSPDNISFGDVFSGIQNGPINVTISNSGVGTLYVDTANISLSGTHASEFSFTTADFPASLEGGQSASIPVYVTGVSLGSISATLTITYRGVDYDVALSANVLASSSPLAVTLNTPEDNATGLPPMGVLLSWTPAASDGTPSSYTVYLARSEANIYTEIIFEDITTTSFNPSSYGHIFQYLDRWYWTVEAHNEYGSAVVETPFSFQIEAPPPIVVDSEHPYREFFDSTPEGSMPSIWTVIDSHTGDDARGWRASSGLASSLPNAAVVFCHSIFSKDEWMITPALTLEGGQLYFLSFGLMAPGWEGSPEALEVHWSTEATISGMISSPPLWNDNSIMLDDYTNILVPFTPPTTGIYYFGWHTYSAPNLDYIAVDDVSLYIPANIDLALNSFYGDAIAMAANEAYYIVTANNLGASEINSYTITLRDCFSLEALASVEINTPLPSGSPTIHGLTWTPEAEGDYTIFAELNTSGDEILWNNSSTPLTVRVLPETVDQIFVGDYDSSTEAFAYPFNFFYEDFVAETLYLADEISAGSGTIAGLCYFNDFSTAQTKQVQIWMQNTTAADLSEAWLPWDNYSLVFDGWIYFPAGQNMIQIPITPFTYTGANLAIRTSRTWEGEWTGDNLWFTSTDPTSRIRTRYYCDDSEFVDHINPLYAYAEAEYPNIIFYLEADESGSSLATPQPEISLENSDIVLEWPPVPNANSYIVQASADPYDFTEAISTTVYENRYVAPDGPRKFFRVSSSPQAELPRSWQSLPGSQNSELRLIDSNSLLKSRARRSAAR